MTAANAAVILRTAPPAVGPKDLASAVTRFFGRERRGRRALRMTT